MEEKKRINEEKKLAKKIKQDEKKLKNKIKKDNKISKNNDKKIIILESSVNNVKKPSEKFSEVAKKIIERNSDRPFPEINDIEN